MEHKHLNAAALADLLATDRTVRQNEQLFHLLAVCPRCREIGGWLLELHQANALPPLFGPIDAALARSRAEASRTMKNVSRPQQPLPSPLPVSKVGEVLPRYLSWPEVISWSSLSRTTLRREIAAARFPAPDTLSPGREAFRVDKLREWQEGRRDWAD